MDNTPDLSHLSDRARERIEAEMAGGAARTQRHTKAVKDAQRSQAAHAEATAEGVSVEDLVARRAADARVLETRAQEAAEAQERAIRANAEKEVRDYNEANGLTAPPTEAVLDEADTLSQERLGQSEHLQPLHDAGDGQPEALQANAAKEVADRVESTNYQGDTTFQGVTDAVDTGPRYDDDGNVIENETIDSVTQPEPHTEYTSTAADIGAEQATAAAAAPTGRKRRAVPTPAQPLGTGPKSE